ncbi:MAG: carbon-nitrogen hydrolase family protein [Deltaproteobacteria bacterium]|nr:carbon-nitrogen hydrolase family protein [Deltaproteobacteria bacterium]
MSTVRVAVVQMTSTADLPANLDCVRDLVAVAVGQGAQLVALPENFAYLRREGSPYPCAQGLDGEIVGCLASLATRHGVWLLGGSFPERIEGDSRVFNTSVLIAPDGRTVAHYRKMHLFDVALESRGGGSYQESASIAPGDEVVVAETPFGGIGMSVCYDLRFPELYREMMSRGARWITVPAAFSPETGPDHWQALLRARAIENQAFVIAPAQCGRHSEDRASYGRSLIVDPWGLVLAQGGDRPCVIVADCDLEEQDRVRRAIPCQRHRRL